jgi:hypothetical protein
MLILIPSPVRGLPKSIGKMPTSCADLKQIGYLKSGVYSVMGGKNVLNVYCDFTVDDKSKSATPSQLPIAYNENHLNFYFTQKWRSRSDHRQIEQKKAMTLGTISLYNNYRHSKIFGCLIEEIISQKMCPKI